jgi:hypothetical protein
MTQDFLDVMDCYVEGGLEAGRWWMFCDVNNQAAVFGAFEQTAFDRLAAFGHQVIGYISSLWKDLTTVKGLPFLTVSKESFDSWVDMATQWIPGIDRKYLYDLLSFDAMEIFSSGLGIASAIFFLKKEDQKKLAEILGSMGIISILTANPIMGILVIGTSAFAYGKKKVEFDKSAFLKSSIVATSSTAIFGALGVLGMPILFELVIVGVLTNVLRKKILDNDALLKSIQEKIAEKVFALQSKAS